MAAIQTHGATDAVTVHDVACHSARSGKGPPRRAETCHIVLVRRGVFAAHVGQTEYLADPCTMLISPAGAEYRISHPGTCGDDCTILELAPEIAEELLRTPRMSQIPLSSRARVATAVWTAAWSTGSRTVAAADAEELALELARSVIGPVRTERRAHATERRRITHAAIAQLHADLARNLPVSTLARGIGCSPFHLMRMFQAETGTTVRRYRMRLRVAAAIERLAAGHDDLVALALELGFSSHAHLCDVVRDEAGASPSQIRRVTARSSRSRARPA